MREDNYSNKPIGCSQRYRQAVDRILVNKYDMVMNFFKVKEINQILSMQSRYSVYMDFCDTRILSEDIDYLKRVYYYRSHSGKPEIENRMKLISEHYATNPKLSTFTYEYPMMIATNTKSLFVRRKKRLRKIQAGEASSDQSEDGIFDFPDEDAPTQYFLDQMGNSSLTEHSVEEDQASFDSVAHNVYEQPGQQISTLSHITLQPNQSKVKVWIYEDEEKINSKLNQKDLSEVTNSKTLGIIDNHHKTVKQSAIEILPIQDKIRLEQQTNYKSSGTLSKYVDILLSKPINFSGLGLSYENTAIDKYKGISISEPQSLDKEREQRAQKRRKIREKAEELLKRVRNQEVMVRQS